MSHNPPLPSPSLHLPLSSPPLPFPSLLPSPPIFLHRLSTVSCTDSLASFNMAATEQDTSPGSKGYDFAPYIDLYSPYTYKLALEYMPSCLERPKVPPAPPVWCVDMHDDIIVVGCGNGHVEVRGGEGSRGSEAFV